MDTGFENNESLSSSFVYRGGMILCVVFVIAFLFILGLLGFFYPQGFLQKATLIFFLALAIIGGAALVLVGMGILRYNAAQLYEDFDFTIFNNTDDAIIISDLSGFVYYSNQNYQKIFTYKPNSSCYAVIADLPGAGALAYRLKVAAYSDLAAQEELRVEQSIFVHSPQKNSVWYNISVQPMARRRKKFLFWRIADISHLQECREVFFSNLQEAINHLDQAPVGFLSVNTQGTILYANAIFAEWFSIDLANFTVGKYSFDQLFDSVGANSSWSDICLQNNKYQSSGYSLPYRFSLSLNSEIGLKILNCFMCASSLLEDKVIYRIVVIPQKIQKEENDNQLKLPSVLVQYFDASPFAIAVVKQEGQLLYMNNAFLSLMGCTGNINLYDIISRRDRVQLERAFLKITTNKNYSVSIETVLENSEERHLRLHVMPITPYHDDALRDLIIISVIETTEQKTLEDKMMQNQKMQAVGQLAGGIAHDFNNVLTAILMSCDLLLNTHRSFDPAYADLINIKNNANRAAALVQQLLAFSRKQTLRPETVDFTELLSDIRNLILPLLGNNIQLKIIHGRDLWSVEVDQASFQRVIMNLVINARDAMPNGGIVTIATNNITKQQSAEFNHVGFGFGEYVQLTISDTGTGISAAVQEKMFEPFFTTKEVGKGTGLGLSMVYGIIKQTGGYIYCDSREGEGTTFHIFLPRYIPDTVHVGSQQIEKVEEQEKNTDLTGSATILLVEDEDAVRMGGLRALQMRGYTVLEAATGVEALAVLEENKGAVDIVISDVVMPEMDGPTLLKESRKNYPDIKFIFVSGYAKDAFAKNLPQDAVFSFLPKPFTLKQLALKVKETLTQ
ncbi:hybrid sensor histidine kinase/response regulator [Bartonella henselae]|uniref:histidine kinase n=1 Tax=Bartonella henselae TaxID=38323 RepID=X5MHK8_BARHN|nr:ATP-binding protein [Bartonella henselae]MDM9997313.1 response regulator [Bartonella henselae]OLL48637.1 hybrid sensor histidine kinase/response regulator [Bartonella henselae]OLL51450.1 hybrid sensor histidine kinase/response regulator [Bartonella henselae]OLL51945.1 hybrid sensor histidine kinase/response regulator [Bartonella henselae]OLL56492.1 hybrid sensor histidine kinase/response regulator [Bartonella henselae]